jgi:hypothetical protein
MQNIVALSIFLIMLAAIINIFRRLKRAANHPKSIDANKYHAVAIGKNTAACSAASQLEGKRFLSNEAPVLPVSGCNVWPCRCRYIHYADRRAEDRRFPFGVRKSAERHTAASERRRRDRRKSPDFAFT